MEVSGLRLAPGALPLRREAPDTRRRLGGPQSQSEHGVGEIVLHPRQESNPSILVV